MWTPRSILCPVDFSEQSRAALQRAAAIARLRGAELTVLSVVQPLLAQAAHVRLGIDLARVDAEPALREFVEAVLPDPQRRPTGLRTQVVTGVAWEVIVLTARRLDVGLIVMGTHGRGGLPRLLLGSTTERVLRRTEWPVLAVSADSGPAVGPAGVRITKILFATDLQERTMAATQWAADLASDLHVPLVLAHVVEPVVVPAPWPGSAAEFESEQIASAQRSLSRLSARFGGTQTDAAVVLGRPADRIASLAIENGADLIVLGQDSTDPDAPVLGSIAYEIIRLGHVAVLVVPTGRVSDAGSAGRPRRPMASTSRDWHVESSDAVADRLGTGTSGLVAAEAGRRLVREGPNQLPEQPPTPRLAVLLHQFRSPLIYLLLAATLVTLALEELTDAGVIAAVLVLNAVIGYTQERRAEASVRALMRLMTPRARVIRDGREREIASRELVPGDLVLLETGARVPADLRLFSTTALRIDESLLTGESLPIVKASATLDAADSPLADRRNMAYMGTVTASGRGRGYVVATGGRTALGAIAESVRSDPEPETPLQQRLAGFTRVIGITVAAAAALVFAVGVARGEAPSAMFMAAVALAVSAVPEGLPIAFTVTLALGVRRMARRQAVVRRLPAVETLGSATVIGSDKTGTLTENRMTVREIRAGRHQVVLEGDSPATDAALRAVLDHQAPVAWTLRAGILTNEAELYQDGRGGATQGDPTEAALLVAGSRLGLDPDAVRAAWPVIEELPFEPERQYSASVRRNGGEHRLFVKGAPERVLAMSTSTLDDTGPAHLDREAILQAAREMGARGLRVLGMAYRVLPGAPDIGAVRSPESLTFLGLQGMQDPPRAGVREAIRGCQDAGLRVTMITGDHADTARAIAAELGIADTNTEPLTGREIERLDDEALQERAGAISVFARITPEQKVRVVQALRRRGEVVAVTGDGVNDAPALKAADIGIAMGRSGTDVAREASDMVLADDNFVSIFAAVEEGRVTFDNLRKVTFFLVSTGAAEIAMILTALAAGWPLPLMAAQLLWLNLVTNGLQDVALAFEPGEPGVLRQPPRARSEGVISALLWERTAITGLVMAAGTLALFRWELDQTGSLARAQTVALSTMVLFQMFHVWNCRSNELSAFRKSPFANPLLFVAAAAAFGVHAVALYVPVTQVVLRVEPLALETWLRMAAVASSIVVAVEIHKFARRRTARSGPERAPGGAEFQSAHLT